MYLESALVCASDISKILIVSILKALVWEILFVTKRMLIWSVYLLTLKLLSFKLFSLLFKRLTLWPGSNIQTIKSTITGNQIPVHQSAVNR